MKTNSFRVWVASYNAKRGWLVQPFLYFLHGSFNNHKNYYVEKTIASNCFMSLNKIDLKYHRRIYVQE